MRNSPSWAGRAAVVLLLALILGVPVFGQEQAARRAINGILDRFEQGFLEKDLAMIADLLAEEWIMASASREGDGARLFTKEQYMRAEEYRFSQVTWLEHRHTDRRIDIRGPVATSTSTIVDKTTNGASRRSRVYHAYALLDGEWKVVFTSPNLAD